MILLSMLLASLGLGNPGYGGSVVLNADSFSGNTAGERILAALQALPASGGVVDARAMSVPNYILVPLDIGAGGKPTTLLLGPGLFITTAMMTVYDHSSIIGVPQGTSNGFPPGVGNGLDPTNLQRTVIVAGPNAQLWAVVRVGTDDGSSGYGAVIQDVTIDGNKAGNGTQNSVDSAGLLLAGAARVDITRVSVQNCKGSGIVIRGSLSRPPPPAGNGDSSSCCTKITKVISVGNDGNGLYVVCNPQSDCNPFDDPSPPMPDQISVQSNDIQVSQSEFEANAGHGIELSNIGAFKLTNSDVSSGVSLPNKYGIYVHGDVNAGYHVITGSQFSNKYGDIVIENAPAENNVITSNVFIGASRPAGTVSPIHIIASKGNTITGNIVRAGGVQLHSAIRIQNATDNVVSSNTISKGGATFASGKAVDAPAGNTIDVNVEY